MTQEQINAYAEASGDHNPIHVDPDFARSVGLPGTIAHGLLDMAILTEAVARWAGGYDQVASVACRFSKPLLPGETVTCTGRVTEIDDIEPSPPSRSRRSRAAASASSPTAGPASGSHARGDKHMGFDFSLTQEQEEIRKLAHEFAVNEMRPVAADYDEKEETPWAVMQKAHDLGLDAASGFPEQYGGGGLDLMSSLILTEQLSWGDAGIGVSINATGLCGAAILAMGTEEQKQKYISQFCDPKQLRIGAMGLTEPNSGSDSMALETTATKVEGGYVLNGTKQFCTNGGIADIQVAFATTDKSAGAAGIAGFVIEKDTPGMRQGRKEKKLGVRASHTAQVIFEDCFVPEEARLGFDKDGNATGPGAVGALLMLEATRPMVAAGAVGIARAAFEFARDYSLERVRIRQADRQARGHRLQARRHGHRDRRGLAAHPALRVDGAERHPVRSRRGLDGQADGR